MQPYLSTAFPHMSVIKLKYQTKFVISVSVINHEIAIIGTIGKINYSLILLFNNSFVTTHYSYY
jgi:hypothetical protein